MASIEAVYRSPDSTQTLIATGQIYPTPGRNGGVRGGYAFGYPLPESTGRDSVGSLGYSSEFQWPLLEESVEHAVRASAKFRAVITRRIFVVPSEPRLVVATSEPKPVVATNDPESVAAIPDIVNQLLEWTGLPKSRMAKELCGVSRESLDNWQKGDPLSVENEIRLRALHAVLMLAHDRFETPANLKGWLFTPLGMKAEMPIALLKEQRWDRARFLAIAELGSTIAGASGSLVSAPKNQWSLDEQQRRRILQRVSEDDVHIVDHDDEEGA